jgi:hypothetical protein
MSTLRKAADRGHFNHGWLDTFHTFSFGAYLDRAHMGFRSIRVINEDVVAPNTGFSTHAHNDMEIITYVISGALAHKDSMGNGSTIFPGHVQTMSAGTGITHSEFNASETEPVHLLQMWIMPNAKGVTPAYAEWNPPAELPGGWTAVASGMGDAGAAYIHQDARLLLAKPQAGEALPLPIAEGRYGWLQVARGSVRVGELVLAAGDGLAFAAEEYASVVAEEASTLLLFDVV